MENRQNVNAPEMQGRFLIEPPDQREVREHAKSHSNIMNRRLKNRERQRRYRARKRLEANVKKASVINQSPPLQVELQLNGILTDGMTQVHCKRDWKKDARRAHLSKQGVTFSGPVNPALTFTESQAPCLPSRMGAEPPAHLESLFLSGKHSSPDNLETSRTALGRRDWKADARNKKN